MTTYSLILALLLSSALRSAPGQATVPPPTTVEPPAPADPALIAAEDLIGKALFLRGFYLANDLTYSSTGQVEATPKAGDWTLAAVNILKATHPAPAQIELEGVRVAIRYNPDAHEFQRHALPAEKMKLVIRLDPAPDPEARKLRNAFAGIFSIGIDPVLQRSMPPLWRHYFDPSLPWPPDSLSNEIILPAQPSPPGDLTPPVFTHKVDAQIPDFARRDNVRGTVQLRIVVDTKGVPQRITVARPLGYGMEESAAEAVSKWRFTPASRAGKPVAINLVLNLDFQAPPPPAPHP